MLHRRRRRWTSTRRRIGPTAKRIGEVQVGMANRRAAQEYSEGDVFAVPLRDHGWVVGVLARHSGNAVVAYFYGPRLAEPPTSFPALEPEDAFSIEHFGDLRLADGTWPVIGHIADWSRRRFPIPDFGRVDGSGRAFRGTYFDDDVSKMPVERLVSLDEVMRLPDGGSSGAGFVEIMLTRLLGPPSDDVPGSPVAHRRSLDWASIVRDARARDTSSLPSEIPKPAVGESRDADSVVVQVRLGDDAFGSPDDREMLDRLEDELLDALERANAGVFDGVENGLGFSTLFMYGPDADRLSAVVEDVLRTKDLRDGSYLVKRYGSTDQEARVDLPLPG
jgi:hypothetical protein